MKKTKRFLLKLLALASISVFSLQAVGCDLLASDEPEQAETHTHKFNQKIAEAQYEKTPASCASDGVYYKSCECGEKGEDTFTVPAPPHTGALCSVCGQDVTSQGLVYVLTNDTFYRVRGLGTCTDTRLYIPSSYNGLPVSRVGESAFRQAANLTNIYVPNSVNLLDNAAFYACWNLQDFVVPDSVQKLGFNLFYECSSLSEITIGSGVKSVGVYAFYGCNNLKTVRYTGDIAGWCNIAFANHNSNPMCKGANLYIGNELLTWLDIPNSVTKLGDYAFQNCLSVERVTTGSALVSVGSFAFTNCKNLKDVTLSTAVNTISYGAFSGCESLESVTFNGTRTWFVTTSEQDFKDKTNGTQIDVSDVAQNATYLKDTYADYYWYSL